MVAASKKYDILDPETGMLDRRIFVDQAIYDEEMDKIFGRAWICVAHESLIPNPNDFFHSYIGEDPVIVTRDSKGDIHVLLNMCRHRGNRVTRLDQGTSENFLCSYHGWTFSNDGRLGHIPGEMAAYFGAIDKDKLGLIQARVDVYAGLIFACWDEEAPSLEDYLGDARWYLDLAFNRSEHGMVVLGPEKWFEPVNWKTPVDNSSDNYHFTTTHLASTIARTKVFGIPGRTLDSSLNDSAAHHVFVNGHSLTFHEGQKQARFGVPGREISDEKKEAWEQYQQDVEAEAERRLGPIRANLSLGNHSLFPNTVLGFRLAHPRGPLKTEFWNFTLVHGKEGPESIQDEVRRVGYTSHGGAAAIVEQDDIDNWNQVTMSGISPRARAVPQDLSMGLGHTSIKEEWPGQHADLYISENNQRGFYQRWMEFMNADGWADIHLAPRTAHYEGTARFRG